jgi:hypothetical protein
MPVKAGLKLSIDRGPSFCRVTALRGYEARVQVILAMAIDRLTSLQLEEQFPDFRTPLKR